MIRAVLIGFATLVGSLSTGSDGDPDSGANEHGFWLHEVQESQSSGVHAPSSVPSNSGEPAVLVGQAACQGADQSAGNLFKVTFCPGATPDTPTPTLADIRHAFAELPLPAARLVIQPPDGVTLVNFDTNFYTPGPHPLTRTVTLLGQQVTIRATPASYTWTYGDGASATTSDPGAPYPDLRVTHRYAREGAFRPRLATTYEGAYRLGAAGPWRPIPGTVTIAGAPQRLRAVEATPVLVGY